MPLKQCQHPLHSALQSHPMTDHVKNRPIVILGPTAGGKSELAVRLADSLGGEVIGADSMQVYRHMDAGTAKPSPEQMRRAKHHLINIVEPTQRFTVADWLGLVEPLIESMQSAGVRPIVVGGTNLYMKALLEGMFKGPGIDKALREKLHATPPAQLHARLKEIDPSSAQRIHINDRKKLVRAIEVYQLTGKPISELQKQWSSAEFANDGEGRKGLYRYDPVLVGLAWPVEVINQRINLRVKAMFYPEKVDPAIAAEVTPGGESLLNEVKRLEEAGVLGDQAREALGYKQVLQYFGGEYTEEEAFEKTKILTRRFAKTQRTWLKRFVGVAWLKADELLAEGMDKLVGEAIRVTEGK